FRQQDAEERMRARGMLAIFLSTLILSMTLPWEANAAWDFSPRRFFSGASFKFRNTFKPSPAASKPRQQHHHAVAHTAPKQATASPRLASAAETPVELAQPEGTMAAPVGPDQMRVG